MSINITALESALQSKLNAATGSTESKEFLLLTKALESLNSGAVAEVATTGDLPTASDNTGRTLYVTAESSIYFSNGTAWASLDPQAVIDGAPAALDTLNELAAALNDDANFATTVTDSIATKMPLAGGTFTGDIDMGSNDITTTGKVLYSNVYSTTGDLPSASTYHGMFAHVHGTGKGYFAHGGNWIELVNVDTNGDLDVAGEFIADSYNETYAALSGTTPAVNCESGNSFSLVLSGATTFTFTNPPASGTAYSFSVEIIQDSGASGHTVTWPSSVDWPAATAPTLTATASAKDIFVFTTRDGGTNWYGFTAGQALA